MNAHYKFVMIGPPGGQSGGQRATSAPSLRERRPPMTDGVTQAMVDQAHTAAVAKIEDVTTRYNTDVGVYDADSAAYVAVLDDYNRVQGNMTPPDRQACQQYLTTAYNQGLSEESFLNNAAADLTLANQDVLGGNAANTLNDKYNDYMQGQTDAQSGNTACASMETHHGPLQAALTAARVVLVNYG